VHDRGAHSPEEQPYDVGLRVETTDAGDPTHAQQTTTRMLLAPQTCLYRPSGRPSLRILRRSRALARVRIGPLRDPSRRPATEDRRARR
jgi:hypothetical protein